MAQTFAIAQSTALQFGDLHCAAILTCGDDCYRDQLGRTRYKLYTWGDNTRGQLGNQTDTHQCANSGSDGENEGSLDSMEGSDLACEPQSVCLGYSVYNVRCSVLICLAACVGGLVPLCGSSTSRSRDKV